MLDLLIFKKNRDSIFTKPRNQLYLNLFADFAYRYLILNIFTL